MVSQPAHAAPLPTPAVRCAPRHHRIRRDSRSLEPRAHQRRAGPEPAARRHLNALRGPARPEGGPNCPLSDIPSARHTEHWQLSALASRPHALPGCQPLTSRFPPLTGTSSRPAARRIPSAAQQAGNRRRIPLSDTPVVLSTLGTTVASCYCLPVERYEVTIIRAGKQCSRHR
jgi:hypothetical protein